MNVHKIKVGRRYRIHLAGKSVVVKALKVIKSNWSVCVDLDGLVLWLFPERIIEEVL